ncbi:EamA family transporter [Thermotoga caldifontis]|uniref:EamA family transporter n=1 Tax=Thermotoga caldifontis TaxID=1508419 RepID=UPI0008707DDD|nr:EamA family transporter [Thermotoga caldifontis]
MSWKVVLAGVCVSLIFGFSFLFTKNALDYVKPLTFLSYRFFVASLFFLFLLLSRAIRLGKKPYWKLWKLIVFQPILYFLFETIGLQRINASEAGMIVALIPILVNVLAIFLLKEKGDRYHYVLLLSSFIGSVLIVGFNLTKEALLGKVSMLIAMVSAALYTILARKLSREFEPHEISFSMMISGFVFFTIVSKLSGEFRLVLNVHTISAALYLGVLSSAVAFFLHTYMVKQAPSILVSLFSNLTTVVACLAGVLFRNERLGLQQILGVVIVLVSLLVMAYRNREKKVDAMQEDAEKTLEEDINSAIHVALLRKDLLLTPHAYERMIERNVSFEELKELLESKSSRAFMQKNGRIKISNGSIEAVLQPSGKVLYLVTVMRKRREWL